MVDLHPFHGFTFNTSKIDDLSSVISPPYDVISNELKENLKKFNAHNIVNLILPDASGPLNKYENASHLLNKWVDENILVKEKRKNLYIFEEQYIQDNQLKSIIGIIGLIKIEDYESKILLRHEKTLSKPREDRLELLRNCRTNFGLIYTLFDDDKRLIDTCINENIINPPDVSLKPLYDKNLSFNIWNISDEIEIANISKYMLDKHVLIADGHHRYETSRLYMHEKASSDPDAPEKYVLVLLMDINQEHINLMPTHRLIKFKKQIDSDRVKELLKNDFEIIYAEKSDCLDLDMLHTLMLEEQKKGKKSFMICTRDNEIFIARLKKDIAEIYNTDNRIDYLYENLDINILHKFILEDILKDHEILEISFTHEDMQVLEKVRKGSDFDMGVIVNAPDKNDLMTLSLNGKLMPQKSTYFYPKPCTGLLMYRFD
jgi:uncharacterized protein (DUF1015 family)